MYPNFASCMHRIMIHAFDDSQRDLNSEYYTRSSLVSSMLRYVECVVIALEARGLLCDSRQDGWPGVASMGWVVHRRHANYVRMAWIRGTLVSAL